MWGTGLARAGAPALAAVAPTSAATRARTRSIAGLLVTALGSRSVIPKSRSAQFAAPALAAALALLAFAAPAAAAPILPTGLPPSLPAFQGAAATAHRITPTIAPQNPFM